MNYKTKFKIEQVVFYFLTFSGAAAIGGRLGAFLVLLEKELQRDLTGKEFFVSMLGALVVLYAAYFCNICLHEVGHMIFGLLTGYKFNSIRFGKLMLVMRDGKLRFSRFNLPGTGGQCIMLPPEKDADEMPVVLYNLGGLLVNLLTFLVGMGLFWILKSTQLIAAMISLTFALVAAIVLVTNGLPFEQIGTDGAHAILLYKNKNARRAFCNQLRMMYYLSNNFSVREMPEELFAYDERIPLDNTLVTAQAVNYYNYLSANKRFAEAKKAAEFILENAKSIHQTHDAILHSELIFIAAVIDHDPDKAKELYRQHKKRLNAMSGFISMQRILFAYFTLVEPDEKKAKKFSKGFAACVKSYPYPKDAEIEQEQFNMVLQQVHPAADSN